MAFRACMAFICMLTIRGFFSSLKNRGQSPTNAGIFQELPFSTAIGPLGFLNILTCYKGHMYETKTVEKVFVAISEKFTPFFPFKTTGLHCLPLSVKYKHMNYLQSVHPICDIKRVFEQNPVNHNGFKTRTTRICFIPKTANG